MTALKDYIEKIYNEVAFEPTYRWEIGMGIPKFTPPDATIVVDVVQQIYKWLGGLKRPTGSDPHGIWIYGHSYGGHVTGQMAVPANGLVAYWMWRIQNDYCLSFKRYVTGNSDVKDYPAHFGGVRTILYTLAGDPDLGALDAEWKEKPPNSISPWFNPEGYNSRRLRRVPFARTQRYWFPGGKDQIIQPYTWNPPFYKHSDFDGTQGLCEIPVYRLNMHRFISRFLMRGHP
jgi:hypothetical protein